MNDDARFEDGGERPLSLAAEGPEDLEVISALLQDAVGQTSDIAWMPKRRRLALLLNRFRWEDKRAAERRSRPYERVRTMLVFDDVKRVRSQGVDPREKDVVLSVLALQFAPAEDGAGQLSLILAGDGEIAAEVECLNVRLRDVTRPYRAPSGHVPGHDAD
ncbi:MAG: DUF2948 family protein [Pseudomonadota bacterium]